MSATVHRAYPSSRYRAVCAAMSGNACRPRSVYPRSSRLRAMIWPNASNGRICSYVTKAEVGKVAAAHAMMAHESSGSRYTSTHSDRKRVGTPVWMPAAVSTPCSAATSRRSAVSSRYPPPLTSMPPAPFARIVMPGASSAAAGAAAGAAAAAGGCAAPPTPPLPPRPNAAAPGRRAWLCIGDSAPLSVAPPPPAPAASAAATSAAPTRRPAMASCSTRWRRMMAALRCVTSGKSTSK